MVEEIYLTVKEMAKLKGCSERHIRLLIKENIICAKKIEVKQRGPGRGGIQYRIPLSSIEKKLQSKFKQHLKVFQQEQEKTDIDTETVIDNYTGDEIEQIARWKKILFDWQKYRNSSCKSKAEADTEFVDIINVQNPDLNLSLRSLYRKWKEYNKIGDIALVDRRGKHTGHQKKLSNEVWDVFEYYYLDDSRKSISLCMKLTEMNFELQGRQDVLPLPSRSTFERGVKAIPIPYLKYFRENEKTFIGECAPYIKRMYDDLQANDIWVADNHTFDVMVEKNSQPVRVYLTAFMDVRSRKITGWCITDAPSSDATIYALKKGCEYNGVPKMLYTDNGREFLFHDLGGNGFRKRRKNEELKLPSILDDLGIEFTTALPRNARAKGIERAFCTVKNTLSKLYDGYTGGTILERPDSLKELVKYPNSLVNIEEFKKQVDTYILGWYNKQSHSGEGMYGKTPDEIFNNTLIERRVIPPEKLNLMFMRYAKGNKGTLKVGKNGVTLRFYGQELQYWNAELWEMYFGREVYVRYSPDDLSAVRVYDEKMSFICVAELKDTLSYKASKEEIRKNQAENRKAVRAVKAYKRNKGIEAENELKLILDKASENMLDIDRPNPKIITPLVTAEKEVLKKVSGDDDIVIDWSLAVERLRRAKEEEL